MNFKKLKNNNLNEDVESTLKTFPNPKISFSYCDTEVVRYLIQSRRVKTKIKYKHEEKR